MKVAFFGTPEFSVVTLRALAEAGYDVIIAVTQPDARAGRGRKLKQPPVKEAALKLGIPVRQPGDIRDDAFLKQLASLKPDIGVTVSYGGILPGAFLTVPKRGFLNVHASLLPKYRGASPIQTAIRRGEKVTGVTIMRMDEGLDTGPIIEQRPIRILKSDNGGTLSAKLAAAGAGLLVEVLPGVLEGSAAETPQNDADATYARALKKSDGAIIFARTGRRVTNHIRAMTPWPGAFAFLTGANFAVPLRVAICEARVYHGAECVAPEDTEPGDVLAIREKGVLVATKKKPILITEIQPAGKRRMECVEFLCGRKVGPGDRFVPFVE